MTVRRFLFAYLILRLVYLLFTNLQLLGLLFEI